MKYFLALCALFASFHISYSETLFIKSDGSQLKTEEHAVAYDIMLTTQFPMSMQYSKKNEIEIINEKLAQKFPNTGIQAKFISKTLYELLSLQYLVDSCRKQISPIIIKNNALTQATNDMLSLRYAITSTKKEKYGILRGIHARTQDKYKELFEDHSVMSHLRPFHYYVNNYIVNSLKFFGLDASSLEDSLNALTLFSFKDILTLDHLGKYTMNNAILKQAIEIEHTAHTKNEFVLYRGTKSLDFERHPLHDINFNRSISFGASLFAGILFDNEAANGACAYTYICCHAPHAYALPIKIDEYIDGPLKNMFVIPPVPTLLGIISEGELFHARSKITDVSKKSVGYCLSENDAQSAQKAMTLLQIDTESKPARVTYSRMLQYIKENYIPIKK